MRRSADWNVIWDDRILEWIRENDGAGTAAEIGRSGMIQASKSTISRRLQKLADHDLVTHIGNGAYIITKKGEGYLDEEYDVERGMWLDRDRGQSSGASAGDTEAENGV